MKLSDDDQLIYKFVLAQYCSNGDWSVHDDDPELEEYYTHLPLTMQDQLDEQLQSVCSNTAIRDLFNELDGLNKDSFDSLDDFFECRKDLQNKIIEFSRNYFSKIYIPDTL